MNLPVSRRMNCDNFIHSCHSCSWASFLKWTCDFESAQDLQVLKKPLLLSKTPSHTLRMMLMGSRDDAGHRILETLVHV